MEIILATAVVVLSLCLAVLQIVRNVRFKALADRRQKMIPVLLGVNAALVLCDASAGTGFVERASVDVCLAVTALSVMALSLNEHCRWIRIVYSVLIVQAVLAAYYALCAFGVFPQPPVCLPLVLLFLVAAGHLAVYAYCLWIRVCNVRLLIQSGNVWSYVCLAVDLAYLAFFLFYALSSAALIYVGWLCSPWLLLLLNMLLVGLAGALVFRISYDSLFVVCRENERLIIESMKISTAESSAAANREKAVYKDLYDRLVAYFEAEKPFLRGDLTINDVVEKVFSNKLYISRAISHYTGRNFCQFVNYYRVMYSVDCFRQNTDLKVSELWSLCGFNSIVSYNMAFRLFMGENPSDWCRAEKIRLSRKKTIFAAD